MKEPATNHDKANMSLKQCRIGRVAGDPGRAAGGPPWLLRGGLPRLLPGGCVPRVAGVARRPPGASLNWSLRRYVRASPPRVWLIRQPAEAGGPAFRGHPGRARSSRPGATGNPGWPAPATAAGGSRPPGRGPRRGIWRSPQRNGQMEHSAQVAVGLRGDVRPGETIALRDSAWPPDLGLTTPCDEVNLESNIFGFVIT